MTDVTGWLSSVRIGIIGLGYVGLPLAVEFGKKFPVLGFDIRSARIEALREGRDETLETDEHELRDASRLTFSDDPGDLRSCNVFIVTVPTPIDQARRPDLGPLLSASSLVGSCLKKGDLVIYESTVYPGCTEEECVPVLEKTSGLVLDLDFSVGYSPERINPGDKSHRLVDIVKVTSGSTQSALDQVDGLYGEIIKAGTFPAESVKVAEAAKVIENTQRDLNIALVNELAIIFDRLNIDTSAVLDAAGTKWNFLPFRPGLVGGHCIGVDPYYLTHKAEQTGYHPDVILAGRRINDSMGGYVADRLVKAMLHRRIQVDGARVLILGLAFKENCPDLRNTRVVDIIRELSGFGIQIDVHDPWIDSSHALKEYGLQLIETPEAGTYDGIILAVSHDVFGNLGSRGVRSLGRDPHVLFDLKSVFRKEESDLRL